MFDAFVQKCVSSEESAFTLLTGQRKRAPCSVWSPKVDNSHCNHSGCSVTTLLDGEYCWLCILLDRSPPLYSPATATSPLRSGNLQSAHRFLRGRQDDGDAQAGVPRHEGACRVPLPNLAGACFYSCCVSQRFSRGTCSKCSICVICTLQSIKDMPVLQDGPPPGGFPSVRYARRIPSTGPAGFTLFAVTASIMAYGFIKVSQPACTCMLRFDMATSSSQLPVSSACFAQLQLCRQCVAVIKHALNSQQPCNVQVGQTNHEKRAAKAEKKAARFAIMPILQAEEDRR